MNEPDSKTHYAILIGIDDYGRNSLKGCVHDVEQIEDLLQNALGGLVQIHSLTASRKSHSSDSTRHAPPKPTPGNVISIFEKVIAEADSGNFVYIHFSGHGTNKLIEIDDQRSMDPIIGDVGLVLLGEEGQNHEVCLWGRQLVEQMKKMTEFGLIVTLVLDCCFSGAMSRNDSGVRCIPYDVKMETNLPYPRKDEAVEETESSADRNGSMLLNWLLNPKDYTILAACDPFETAIGATFEGEPYGALSYFLLDSVKCLGLTRLHRIIFNRVYAKFKANPIFHKQNPVLFGNLDQPFFGPKDEHSTGVTIPIVRTKEGTLELQAGYVHGINDGDELVLFSLRSEPVPKHDPPNAKVIKSNAFTSVLEVCTGSSTSPRIGWSATVTTNSRLCKVPIRVAVNTLDKDTWLVAMAKRSLTVHSTKTDNSFAFDLRLNESCEYEISDESGQRLTNLPQLLQHQVSIDQICAVLEHLARFRLFKDLTNEVTSTDLSQSIEVCVKCNGREYQPENLVELKHGDKTEFSIVNKGQFPIHIFVFDLDPYWKIENMVRATSSICKPQGKWSKKIAWEIPEEISRPSLDSCEDILKVIITSQPTSFELIELPDIWDQTSATESHRSGEHKDPTIPEAWTAINFVVRISR